MKHFLLILTFTTIFFSANSQETFEWNTQYLSFFDNREYAQNPYIQSQTMFGNRLDVSLGFRIDSVHLIQAGVDYLYEFGADGNSIPLFPTLYYSFSNKHFDFHFGAFPRHKLPNYPTLLLTDTLNYYSPNIEGALINYKGKYGYQNVWADWVGRQTDTNNERFLAGTSGLIKVKNFFFENYLYMYHHAATAIRDSSFHLRDNGGGAFLFGIDLREKYFFKVSLGSAFSYDRYRPDPYEFNKGLYGKLLLEYKRFALRFTHYNGESISLGYGDQLYKAEKYTRIDGDINLIKHKNVSLLFQYSAHLIKERINSSQLIKLKFNVNGSRAVKFN